MTQFLRIPSLSHVASNISAYGQDIMASAALGLFLWSVFLWLSLIENSSIG